LKILASNQSLSITKTTDRQSYAIMHAHKHDHKYNPSDTNPQCKSKKNMALAVKTVAITFALKYKCSAQFCPQITSQ